MTDESPDPDGEALVFQFFNEIGILAQLSGALFNRLLPDGVHVSHFAVLNHLVRVRDGRTPAEIAAAMQVTKPTMTHTLGVLGARGFIALRAHENDARSKRVFLTEAGRRFREDAIRSLAPASRLLLEQMRAADLKAALPALRHVRQILDAERG